MSAKNSGGRGGCDVTTMPCWTRASCVRRWWWALRTRVGGKYFLVIFLSIICFLFELLMIYSIRGSFAKPLWWVPRSPVSGKKIHKTKFFLSLHFKSFNFKNFQAFKKVFFLQQKMFSPTQVLARWDKFLHLLKFYLTKKKVSTKSDIEITRKYL